MAAGDVDVGITSTRAYKCASFDGVDDIMTVVGNGEVLSSMTISFDCLFIGNDAVDYNRILEDASNSVYLSIRTTHNRLVFNRGTEQTSPKITRNKWCNLIVTSFSNGQGYYYIDGVAGSLASFGTNNLAISNLSFFNRPALDRSFKCCVRNFRIWDKVLSTDEIAQVYAGNNSVARSNLVGEWKLHDNYNDTSGNGNHGTNSGSVLQTVEDQVAAAIKAQRVTANDKFLLAGLTNGGQVIHAAIEEVP